MAEDRTLRHHRRGVRQAGELRHRLGYSRLHVDPGRGLDCQPGRLARVLHPRPGGGAGGDQRHSPPGKRTSGPSGPWPEGPRGGVGEAAGAVGLSGGAGPGPAAGGAHRRHGSAGGAAAGQRVRPAVGAAVRRNGPVCGYFRGHAYGWGGVCPAFEAGADPVRCGHHPGLPGSGPGQPDYPQRPAPDQGAVPYGGKRPRAARRPDRNGALYPGGQGTPAGDGHRAGPQRHGYLPY